MFLILVRKILCPQQMFPSLRNMRYIMSNNVSATMCPRLPVPYDLNLLFRVNKFRLPISTKTDAYFIEGDRLSWMILPSVLITGYDKDNISVNFS